MAKPALLSFAALLTFLSGAQAAELDALTLEIQILDKKIEKLKKEKALSDLQTPPQTPNLISIKSATYGSLQGQCDATNFTKIACSGEENCQLTISNEMCGDPTPKPKNVLKIIYECNGIQKTFSGEEGLKASLICP